jgi:hypothetical protein
VSTTTLRYPSYMNNDLIGLIAPLIPTPRSDDSGPIIESTCIDCTCSSMDRENIAHSATISIYSGRSGQEKDKLSPNILHIPVIRGSVRSAYWPMQSFSASILHIHVRPNPETRQKANCGFSGSGKKDFL